MSICIKNHIEEHDTYGKHLGVTIQSAEAGHAVASMPVDDRHRNGVGLVHGGALFALADIAFAAASNACRDTAMLNVATSVSYMKSGKNGPLTAEARRIHEGKTLATYEVQVRDPENTLLAVCQITGYRTQMSLLEQN